MATRRKPRHVGELLGTVLEWSAPVTSPSGYRTGGGAGKVRLDDGNVVPARWSGQATLCQDRRPSAKGQRVAVSRDSGGRYRATLVESAAGAIGPTLTPPRRAPLRPLPETLRRAVGAALALGESPWTIAARHGVSVEQVSRT
jgi:hypothetical protein